MIIFPFHRGVARVGYENNIEPAAEITCFRNAHFLQARILFWIV